MNVLTSVPRTLPLTSWKHYVLVVEEDPALRDSYRAALRAAGFAAVGVEDCLGALHLAESQRPSAIILDLVRPRPDGHDVQRVLKSSPHTRDIPIVVITDRDIREFNSSDFACVLRKPLDVAMLVVAVRHTISQFGATSA